MVQSEIVRSGITATRVTNLTTTEAAVLALLAIEGERSRYDLMKSASKAIGYIWAPAKTQLYALLPRLAERGLATSRAVREGARPEKQLFRITDAGRAELEERREERGGDQPWEFGPIGEGFGQLRDAGFQLAAAAMQVARTGSEAQRKQAAEILADARKKLYALLAED